MHSDDIYHFRYARVRNSSILFASELLHVDRTVSVWLLPTATTPTNCAFAHYGSCQNTTRCVKIKRPNTKTAISQECVNIFASHG